MIEITKVVRGLGNYPIIYLVGAIPRDSSDYLPAFPETKSETVLTTATLAEHNGDTQIRRPKVFYSLPRLK